MMVCTCKKRRRYILVETVDMWPEAQADMTRWWSGGCRAKTVDGELLLDVQMPDRNNHFRLYEGIKRLASFAVRARVVLRSEFRFKYPPITGVR